MAQVRAAELPHTIAVDIGGTFTDLIAYDAASGELRQAKSLTTPRDLVRGILDCLEQERRRAGGTAEVVHGSTVAINTVLERNGARTALLVTKGTRDVYAIGRGNRPEAYDIFFRRPVPLVPRSLTFEVVERIRADGEVDDAARRRSGLPRVCEQLLDAGRRVGGGLPPALVRQPRARAARRRDPAQRQLGDVYVSLSHEILREYREYERISTTVVNAYVGPIVGALPRRLDERLARDGLHRRAVDHAVNGGVMTPATAARRPVTMLESGPVGGIIAAARVGRQLGIENVIAFDMGGTTAKASLIRDGTPSIADGYYVGGYDEGHPVCCPVVDVVEVGAGGGSIAWIDEVGALKVGPAKRRRRAGADLLRRGAARADDHRRERRPRTDTAERLHGRRDAARRRAAPRGASTGVAEPLGPRPMRAALGILDIAIAKMALAVREVSVAKGYDPRDFVLVAFGGAGPLHAAAIARELHIPRVSCRRFPGHFSAVGMLLS